METSKNALCGLSIIKCVCELGLSSHCAGALDSHHYMLQVLLTLAQRLWRPSKSVPRDPIPQLFSDASLELIESL